MAAVIGTSILCRSIPYHDAASFPAKLAAWAAHCAVMGAVLAPLAMLGGPILMRAAVYSAGIVGGGVHLLKYLFYSSPTLVHTYVT